MDERYPVSVALNVLLKRRRGRPAERKSCRWGSGYHALKGRAKLDLALQQCLTLPRCGDTKMKRVETAIRRVIASEVDAKARETATAANLELVRLTSRGKMRNMVDKL